MNAHTEFVGTTHEMKYEGNVRFGGRGDLVQILMNKAQLNTNQAADLLGGDPSAWSLWANNKREISDEKLAQLAVAAGMNPDEVFAYCLVKSMERSHPTALKIAKVRHLLRNVLTLLEDPNLPLE